MQYANLRINKNGKESVLNTVWCERPCWDTGHFFTAQRQHELFMKKCRKQCSTSWWVFYSFKMLLNLLPLCLCCVWMDFHMDFYSQLTTGNSLTHVKATHLSLGGIRESPQWKTNNQSQLAPYSDGKGRYPIIASIGLFIFFLHNRETAAWKFTNQITLWNNSQPSINHTNFTRTDWYFASN